MAVEAKAPGCVAQESASIRVVRLTSSIVAMLLAYVVFAVAGVTASFAILTMRDGSQVTGHVALFALAVASCALAVLCTALLSLARAAALALWAVLAVLACFAALAFAPFTRGTVLLGYTSTSANLTVYLVAALVAIFALTQFSARLARRSGCSCT